MGLEFATRNQLTGPCGCGVEALTVPRPVVSLRPSGSEFGLTDDKWSAAQSEVRAAILDAACERRFTWDVAPRWRTPIHPLPAPRNSS